MHRSASLPGSSDPSRSATPRMLARRKGQRPQRLLAVQAFLDRQRGLVHHGLEPIADNDHRAALDRLAYYRYDATSHDREHVLGHR